MVNLAQTLKKHERPPIGSWYVSGYCGGQPVQICLDSGAEATCLNPDIFERIPINKRPTIYPSPISATGIDNLPVEITGMVELVLEMGHQKVCMEVLLIEEMRQGNIDVPLGNDFTRLEQFYKKDWLYKCYWNEEEIAMYNEKKSYTRGRLNVKKETTIPGGGKGEVWLVLDGNPVPALLAAEQAVDWPHSNVILHPALFDLTRNSLFKMDVTNLNSYEVTMKKGTIAATLKPVQRVSAMSDIDGRDELVNQNRIQASIKRISFEMKETKDAMTLKPQDEGQEVWKPDQNSSIDFSQKSDTRLSMKTVPIYDVIGSNKSNLLMHSAQPIPSAQLMSSARLVQSARPGHSARLVQSARPGHSARLGHSAQPMHSARLGHTAQLMPSAQLLHSAQPGDQMTIDTGSPYAEQLYIGSVNVETQEAKPSATNSISDEDFKILVDHLPDHMKCLAKGLQSTLTYGEMTQLLELLVEFEPTFQKSDKPLSRTTTVEHGIEVEGRPIKQAPRRLPYHKQAIVKEELEKMLKAGVIRPSSSPWASPIVLVTKKDGTTRFCIDYRLLNAVTIKDAFPLPRIDESLDTLAGSVYFCTMDLASGFWQIGMMEDDKAKTAFCTKFGLFEFNVMPFGLCNAPATFERLTERVLRGLLWEECLVYIDDVIVFGKTFSEVLLRLRKVLERFREHHLSVKAKKCDLFKKEVEFLGHVVSEEGIKCNPKKVADVKNCQPPKTVTEVRSFLGLAGYYRKFVDQYSKIARPLTELTKKAVPFIWSEDCQKAFDALKLALTESPVLAYPDMTKPFILDTDASGFAIGAVLSQKQDNGDERPVAYASYTLSDTQSRYCTTNRELLAVVVFVEHFHHYLLGAKFYVRVDHASLKWLQNFKSPQGIVARWLVRLGCYDFTIEHRKGEEHGNADGLSRMLGSPPVPKLKRLCKFIQCGDCWGYRSDEERSEKCVQTTKEKQVNIKIAKAKSKKKQYKNLRRSQRLASQHGAEIAEYPKNILVIEAEDFVVNKGKPESQFGTGLQDETLPVLNPPLVSLGTQPRAIIEGAGQVELEARSLSTPQTAQKIRRSERLSSKVVRPSKVIQGNDVKPGINVTDLKEMLKKNDVMSVMDQELRSDTEILSLPETNEPEKLSQSDNVPRPIRRSSRVAKRKEDLADLKKKDELLDLVGIPQNVPIAPLVHSAPPGQSEQLMHSAQPGMTEQPRLLGISEPKIVSESLKSEVSPTVQNDHAKSQGIGGVNPIDLTWSMYIDIPELDLDNNSTQEEDERSLLSGLDTDEQRAEWLSWLRDYDSALNAKGVTPKNFKYTCPTPPGKPPEVPRQEFSNWLKVESNMDLRKLQMEDPGIKVIIHWMEQLGPRPAKEKVFPLGKMAKALWAQWINLVMKNGILYRELLNPLTHGATYQYVTPPSIRSTIFRHLHTHCMAAHLGITRTINAVRARFYWPGHRSDLKRWCQQCKACNQNREKPGKSTRQKLAQPTPKGRKWERVFFDILTLVRTKKGNKYILMMCDAFSKWAEGYAIPNHTALTVSDVMAKEWVCHYGTPLELHSDRGPEMRSELMVALYDLLEMDKSFTTSFRPQSNGQCERMNRTVCHMLRSFAKKWENTEWDDLLLFCMAAYRRSVHETTGCTPNLMVFGEELRLPIDWIFGGPPDEPLCPQAYVEKIRNNTRKASEFAQQMINDKMEDQKRGYDRIAGPVRKFGPGENVWYFYTAHDKKVTDRPWQHYIVTRTMEGQKDPIVYEITRDQFETPRRVHADVLRKYHGLEPIEQWWETKNFRIAVEFIQGELDTIGVHHIKCQPSELYAIMGLSSPEVSQVEENLISVSLEEETKQVELSLALNSATVDDLSGTKLEEHESLNSVGEQEKDIIGLCTMNFLDIDSEQVLVEELENPEVPEVDTQPSSCFQAPVEGGEYTKKESVMIEPPCTGLGTCKTTERNGFCTKCDVFESQNLENFSAQKELHQNSLSKGRCCFIHKYDRCYFCSMENNEYQSERKLKILKDGEISQSKDFEHMEQSARPGPSAQLVHSARLDPSAWLEQSAWPGPSARLVPSARLEPSAQLTPSARLEPSAQLVHSAQPLSTIGLSDYPQPYSTKDTVKLDHSRYTTKPNDQLDQINFGSNLVTQHEEIIDHVDSENISTSIEPLNLSVEDVVDEINPSSVRVLSQLADYVEPNFVSKTTLYNDLLHTFPKQSTLCDTVADKLLVMQGLSLAKMTPMARNIAGDLANLVDIDEESIDKVSDFQCLMPEIKSDWNKDAMQSDEQSINAQLNDLVSGKEVVELENTTRGRVKMKQQNQSISESVKQVAVDDEEMSAVGGVGLVEPTKPFSHVKNMIKQFENCAQLEHSEPPSHSSQLVHSAQLRQTEPLKVNPIDCKGVTYEWYIPIEKYVDADDLFQVVTVPTQVGEDKQIVVKNRLAVCHTSSNDSNKSNKSLQLGTECPFVAAEGYCTSSRNTGSCCFCEANVYKNVWEGILTKVNSQKSHANS